MTDPHEHSDHPGTYVREEIIPSGMSVTVAAERLGISRVALSNFLNGKSSLSPRMATRLEKAFGADRKRLVDMQAAYDAQRRHDGEKKVAVRAFVPSFLSIKARQIEAWAANEIDARALLPVLLRKLVHSTGEDLRKIDFPGYDNSQRKGPDGFVDSGAATPWVPVGRSYWEFSTYESPTVKANRDYAARLKSVAPSKRRDSTFVFVTPRNWTGKAAWERRKSETGEWKSVKAFDANDLEQWLEQSVPTQVWLAEQLGLPTTGLETLDQAWTRWADGSEPSLTPDIFAPAVAANKKTLTDWLARPCERPFVVAADSRLEALAFLACLFEDESLEPSKKDLAAVFVSPERLRTLVASSVPFIPIVYSEDTERELAGAYRRLHCIVFRHRNSVEPDADIELTLLRDDNFREALRAIGFDESGIDRLARESGYSPTILRRRLSKVSAIRKPEWASDDSTARALVAMSLIGAWQSDLEADRRIVSDVAGRAFEEIESDVRLLLEFDDSPVWSTGQYRGVASKIDSLFAVARVINASDLERFFKAAEIVLAESDPALELPEKNRWAAALYEKRRRHSEALRKGVCETLVLLSLHGNYLFLKNLGINVEGMVATLIRQLLTPLTTEKLLSHNQELSHYAEAAPEAFLTMLEEDLACDKPVVYNLLRPTQGDAFFAAPPRTGLLWALECLAWNPKMLARVARVLASLSRLEINDNWANKPEESLKEILKSWVPQTAASLEQRLATLKLLVTEFPTVAWALCIDNVKPGPSFGSPTYRPRWRNDASGAGEVVTRREAHEFSRQALDFLIDWPSHNERTLGELVELLEVLPEPDEVKLWERVDEWSQDSGEDVKAMLRERIRQSVFTRSGSFQELPEATRARVREVYELLRVDDPVIRHGWLFANQWVQVSAEGGEEDELDFSRDDESVDTQRREAMTEIFCNRGFAGIRDMLSRGGDAHVIGQYVALTETGLSERTDFVRRCLSVEGDLRDQAERCLQGYLWVFRDEPKSTTLQSAAKELEGKELNRLFAFAPFQASTWRLLDDSDKGAQAEYWKVVTPSPGAHSPDELTELIDCLLDARRPRAAFAAARLSLKDVETSRLERLLFDVATVNLEPAGQYQLRSYDVSKALDSLDGRAGVSPDAMALLEFLFIDALNHSDRGIPNLESQIVNSPQFFVRVVAFAYGRGDGGEDTPEWKIEDPEKKRALASAAHRVLERIKRIPGEDESRKIQAGPLIAWITEVRQLLDKHGRVKIGDQLIGQLLARASAGENGDWPCHAVCQAMEGISSSDIGTGFFVGVRNSRGVQLRGEGGSQERELAERYRAMAERLHFEFPNVGQLLEDIAQSFDSEAEWWDTETEKNKRLQL